MQKTKRVKVVTGLKCNIQCVFCYYRDSLNAPNRSYDEVVKDIDYALKKGVEEIDFSGGEPTIHPKLPELITKAKQLGIKRVCIISNGLRLADRQYIKTLKDAGLDEILFSIHGPSTEIHDEITTIRGSFNRILSGIENALIEGIMIRTNTVVNKLNVRSLINLCNLLLQFNPEQVNFITINDWCFAKHIIERLMIRYSEMAPYLQQACDFLEGKVKHVNVRYIPFCFMKGYERFVCNHKQVMYDPYEWVPRVRARLEIQNNLFRYLGIVIYGFLKGKQYKNVFNISFEDILDNSVVDALRNWFYLKNKDCKACKYYLICDGIEKTYARQFGMNELSPETGEKVIDSNYFRRT